MASTINAINATKSPRMSLAAVTRGQVSKPHRVLIYGPEGVGKTTFAASAPDPIIIGTEDGSGALDVPRFPRPESWGDVLEAVDALTAKGHDYRTCVIDSLDWAEPMVWAHVCAASSKSSIEDFGFGKGYVEALNEARKLLAVREWADAVLFANWEQYAAEVDGRTKGVSTGRRVLHTTKTAAFEAKNRFALPDEIDLSWAGFAKAVERNRQAPQEIRDLLAGDAEKTAKFDAWATKSPPLHELVAMRDRLIADRKGTTK